MTATSDYDHREELRSAEAEALAPVEGVDQLAHREVLQRVAAEGRGNDVYVVRDHAIDVLTEAVDAAHAEWDPYVHAGSAAVGIVRALRDLGAVPQ